MIMTLILSIRRGCCIAANFASLFGLTTNTSSQYTDWVLGPLPLFESGTEAKYEIDGGFQMHQGMY